MKKIVKNIIIYIIFFLILWLIGFNHNYGDPLANYGFSYAIAKGEIPYRDFNIISTPLFAFFGAIGLLIYNNYLVFLLEQALLLTIAISLLEKIYDYKIFFLLIITSIFQFSNIIPTYNFFCLFLLILIIYLEKKHSNKDYLIGFLIGLTILTKHTIGIFFIIPSLVFYHKNKKKIIKRIISALLPCLIFIVYLFINHAFFEFIDLSILGLFNFAVKNHTFNFLSLILLLFFLFSIFLLTKHKKEITNYYLFFTFLFAIPIIDLTHLSLYILCLGIMLLPYLKLSPKNLKLLSISITMPIIIFTFLSWLKYNLVFTKKINHFEYNISTKYYYEENLKKFNYISNYKNAKYISYSSMFYDISSNNKIDYFDVLLNGNYGIKESQIIINKIKKMHQQFFVINMTDYKNKYAYSQFSKEIAKYIIDNCKKIDSKYDLVVYYKE